MDFAFCAGFGSFILNRPSAPVVDFGYLVETDAVSDAGDDELRGSRDFGGRLFLSVCLYIFSYCLVSCANQAVRMGAAFFDSRSGGALVWGTIPCIFCALKQSILKDCAPCVSTLFLHRLWRDMACARACSTAG